MAEDWDLGEIETQDREHIWSQGPRQGIQAAMVGGQFLGEIHNLGGVLWRRGRWGRSGGADARGCSGSAELDGTSGDEGELNGASGDEGELGGASGDEGELGGTSETKESWTGPTLEGARVALTL